MKRITTLIAFLVLVIADKAQTWNWAKQGTTTGGMISYTWGGYPASYYPFGYLSASVIDSKGNVASCGYFDDNLTFGTYKLTCPPQVPASFVVEYDSTGNLLWADDAKISSPGAYFYQNMADAFAIATDKSGNVYVTGYFHDSVTFGTYLLVSNAYTNGNVEGDVFLVKYSPTGTVLWAKQSVGTTYAGARGSGLATDSACNIYVTGPFYDTLAFGSHTLITPYSYGSCFVTKYDSNGNVIWARQSYGAVQGGAQGMSCNTLDAKGNIYISGLFTDTLIWGTQKLIDPSSTQQYGYITKLNNSGNAIWAREISGDSLEDWHCALATDKLGNSYIATTFKHNIAFGPYHFNNPKESILLAKCNSNGAILWAKTCVGVYGWFNNLSVDTVGHLYLAGEVSDTAFLGSDTIIGPPFANPEVLAKFDTAGNFICASVINYAAWMCGLAAEPKGNGAYIGACLFMKETLGTTTIGPPSSYDYSWPFVAKWTGCSDKDFYAYSTTIPPCKGECNGVATAIPSGGYSPYSYVWDTKPTQTTQSVSGLCPGNYTVTVTDDDGYKSAQVVTVSPPTNSLVVQAIKDSICYGNSTTLIAYGVTSYSWSPFTGLSCTTCSNTMANPTSTTTYTVTGADTLGCKDTTLFKLTVLQLPAIIGGTDICEGSSTTLTVNGGSSYVWNTGQTSNSISVAPSSGTTYSVIVNNYNTCTDTLYSTILVRPLPVATVCCDSTITPGQNVQLIATGGIKYSWMPASYLNCDTCSSPVATPLETTIYTVTVTNDSGCSVNDFVTITVNCNIFIPDAFSPNGDGQNDYLYVRGKCIKDMTFIIFDRWGNKIFESDNQDTPWDGTCKGQPMNTGTYVYYLSASTYDGKSITKKGNVTLVR